MSEFLALMRCLSSTVMDSHACVAKYSALKECLKQQGLSSDE